VQITFNAVCAIISDVEEAKHIQKLSRQSDLFDQIVKKSLKRLANRMQFKHDQAEDRCVNVRKLLGKLAWESFVAGSSCVDWTSFEKKHEEIASCGLVEKVDYEWVHKSVQEYLAAEHVCVHLDLKKKKIGKKLKQLRSKMEERSDLFFGFVCGLGGKPFKYLDRWFPSDFGSKRENGNLVSVGPLLWIEETRNNDWERLKMFLSEHWKDVMASFGGLLLRGAANHGTVKAMNFLLEYCQSQIDEKDAMDYSALHLAVCAGHFEIARLLVIAGAEVNSADKDQWTILWSAFHQEQKAIALLLLEYGADVKTSDEVPSLMHFAAYYGWADLVPSLKCKGVDVNGVYGDLARPLHWAATQGKLDCVKALIQEGADASARDGGSCTPLMNAAFAGHFNVVEYLAPQLCSDLSEALWWACRSDNFSSVEVVDLLIRNGADLNASDIIHGWTALFFAAKSGCGAVVDLLIKLGADVNHVDLRGRSYTYFLQAHDNRYCDICRESIFGKRFASLERTDYDECEFCHNGETQEKFELKIL
jgi:ankyrin repeat protein